MLTQPSTRDYLERINQSLHQNTEWNRFHQGLVHELYRGMLQGEPVVLKVRIPGNPDPFGVSISRESSILKTISSNDWAPQIIDRASDGTWTLMQDYGPSLDKWGQCRQEYNNALLKITDEYFRIPPPNNHCWNMDYSLLFAQYITFFKGQSEQRLSKAEKTALISLTERLIGNIDALPHCPPTLVHHDFHPGNICMGKYGLKVLDWEYAALGNPWLDAANLVSHFNVTESEVQQLQPFAQFTNQTVTKGLRKSNQIMRDLELIWKQHQNLRSVVHPEIK